MNFLPMLEHQSTQKLNPLGLLVRSVGQQFTGCLYVTSHPFTWAIFLEQGRLSFATNSDRPLERLERHLQDLSRQIPALTRTVQTQLQYQFAAEREEPLSNADFHAIRWLVEHHYLDLAQATMLIEGLAKEVIEPFLSLTEGEYEFIQQAGIDGYSGLCQIELRPLVEACQLQARRKRIGVKAPVTLPNPLGHSPPNLEIGHGVTQSPAERAVPETGGYLPGQSVQAVYTIACVDDSSTILEAINCFLEEAQFSVVMINDPLKALMQIVRTKPDVVLMDVGMPNLDGYELCSLLRRHSSFKHIPIIMVTGHTGLIDRAKAKLVGASGYLTKPFTRSELLKIVFKHLG